jgi:hypothetical protein
MLKFRGLEIEHSWHVKLERIPLQVLLMLIEQHDKVVTREAIGSGAPQWQPRTDGRLG